MAQSTEMLRGIAHYYLLLSQNTCLINTSLLPVDYYHAGCCALLSPLKVRVVISIESSNHFLIPTDVCALY